ncbi:hypothetical protein J3E68DRAFT_374751 [Trichoderma sp. SZMC 28012]
MATESPAMVDYDSGSDSGSDYFVDAEETIVVTTEDVPGDSKSLATIDEEIIEHLDKRQMPFHRIPDDVNGWSPPIYVYLNINDVAYTRA